MRTKQLNDDTDYFKKIGPHRDLQMLYLSVGAWKKAFAHGTKMLFVDGTYLKGKYGGTLLAAASLDGNNNIFIVAIAYAENECDDSYDFFLGHLRRSIAEDIENCDIRVMSDRHQSIANMVFKHFNCDPKALEDQSIHQRIIALLTTELGSDYLEKTESI